MEYEMSSPILITGMHRSGGSWVAKMIEGGGGVVHVNEPFNRRHPPGLTPGILRVPPPRAYQHVGPHNEAEHLPGFRDMLELRYDLAAELRTNHGVYDLAKAAKYLAAFTLGRARGLTPLIDDPYMVFAAEWLAERLDCRVVMLVRHPAGIVSSLKRIGNGWADNLPDIASQPELVRRYLSSHAAALQRAADQPLDPIAHGALLWLLIHSSIAQQVARHPEFIVVRYEDMASDPLPQFRSLYERLDLPFDDDAEKAIRAGSMAGSASRRSAWGRVGMARTAFQPMESKANAWAWRDRLSTQEIADVIRTTRQVASQFYSSEELAVRLEPAA
jgi:Sulfotransferase family